MYLTILFRQVSVYISLCSIYVGFFVGMLGVFCSVLLDNLSKLPGDARTMVGFLTYDNTLHFYNLKVNVLYCSLSSSSVVYM